MDAMVAPKKKSGKRTPKPSKPTNWSEELEPLRDAAKLSQKQLGKLLGVSQNLISAWERGTRIPDASRQILLEMFKAGNLKN